MKEKSRPLEGRFGLKAIAYFFLVFALLTTALFYWQARRGMQSRDDARFQSKVQGVQEVLVQRMQGYLDRLLDVRAFFSARNSIDQNEWNRFVQNLEIRRRYPGLVYLGYVSKVPRDELPQHLDFMRRNGFPDYKLLPEGDRDVYYPIVFVTHFGSEVPAHGWDPNVFPVRQAALEQARNSGLPAMTGRVTVYSPNKQEPGFVVYLPVYQFGLPLETIEHRTRALQGFVFGVFSSEQFLHALDETQVRVAIYDMGIDPGNLLADHIGGNFKTASRKVESQIPVINRTWVLRVTPAAGFEAANGRFLGWTLIVGGAFSLIVFGVAWMQIKARASAETLAVELKKSEESLRDANEQLHQKVEETQATQFQLSYERDLLRALLDNCHDRIYFKDAQSRFLRCSRDLIKRLGLQNESQVIGKTDFDFHPQERAQEFFEDEQKILSSGKPLVNKIEKQTNAEGQEIWASVTKVPIRNHRGFVTGLVGISRDITTLKQTEMALAVEKERLAVTLKCIGDGVITTDVQGRVLMLNQVAEEMTGWRQADAVGRPLTEVFRIINARTRETCLNPVEKVLQTGEMVELDNHTVLISRDGGEREIANCASPIRQEQGRIIGVVLDIRDVTEESRREAELLKASKLESVGLLAGGIAHDFNNILTAIIGNLSLARMHVANPDKVTGRLEQAEKAAMRARDLTQQLLTFAKGGAPIRKRVEMADVIRDCTEFVLHGANVSCDFKLAPDLWPANVDEGQISQVIHNLVINAKQAMPDGGRIEVMAENMTLDAEAVHPLPAGNYLKFSIRDHGVGIPEEHLTKIFDPYFTTKSQGNGLGLATAYSIVRRHDGQIVVQTSVGEGTVFHVYLPASAKAPEKIVLPSESRNLRGRGKILIMDDESEIHSVAGAMLEMLGYEVHSARDGAEAIQHYMTARSSNKPFAAVIMDLTVPNGMGGKEAIRRLKEVDPSVKAVVSSGYSYDPVMANYREYGFAGVVTKPYRAEDLGQILQELLSGEHLVGQAGNGDSHKSN